MNEPKYEEFVGVITSTLELQVRRSPKELCLKPDAEASIKKFYELCRSQMKLRMAQNDLDKTKPWDQQLLDRHKIAAAVCWAVTRAQPVDTKHARTANDRSANETAALSTSLQILLSFAADDANRAGKPALASYFSHGPALPVTTDNIAFTVHVARCLYWHVHKNSMAEPDIDKWLDPFQLAIMYYMIERFTSLEGKRMALEPPPVAS